MTSLVAFKSERKNRSQAQDLLEQNLLAEGTTNERNIAIKSFITNDDQQAIPLRQSKHRNVKTWMRFN